MMMPAEKVSADADCVPGLGDAPEPLIILITAVGPHRVDGATLIELAGEQDVGQNRRLASTCAEIRTGDGVRFRDAGRLRADPGAVGVTAPEAVVERLHATGHATGAAVLERSDGPAHPIAREHDVAVHQRNNVS